MDSRFCVRRNLYGRFALEIDFSPFYPTKSFMVLSNNLKHRASGDAAVLMAVLIEY